MKLIPLPRCRTLDFTSHSSSQMLSLPLLLVVITLICTVRVNSQATATEDDLSVPLQTGPMADLFGQELHALQLVSETQAELVAFGTTDVLQHADVVGIYFSADWCGPCRQVGGKRLRKKVERD